LHRHLTGRAHLFGNRRISRFRQIYGATV
jgi:hypothetical protein